MKDKMKNINKLTKKRNNLKIMIIIMMAMLVILVSFSIVSASMYDTLNSLKGKNCTLTQRDSISPAIRTALINKFGLTTTGVRNCSFVVDYLPLYQNTKDLIGMSDFWYTPPWYTEINHLFNGTQEYIFILGQNSSALNIIANLTVNYENYNILKRQNTAMFPEIYFSGEIPPEEEGFLGCSDNPSASAYEFNQAFYTQPSPGSVSSFCVDENELIFVFCEGNILSTESISCECNQRKCLPGYKEIPYWIASIGEYDRFAGGIVDNNFVDFVVSGWINR